MAEKRATARRSSRIRRGSRGLQDARQKYKGHEVVIHRDDPGHRVLIDGEPFRYGRTARGFYLDVYAYDRSESLIDVVRRYLDYRDAATQAGKGGSQ